ncbi:outer membrane protein assembly factor BamB [Georgfuchsia toluolica]|nr:outer membrane protein assembly factor BamB [Georgfuchsia toluolica]
MLRISALLLMVSLVGCSALNPWSSSKDKLKPLELPPLTQTAVNLKTLWHVSVGKSEPYVLTPAVAGGSVFVAAADGALSRFDNGKEVWRIATDQTISGGVGSDGKVVVVGTPKGEILAFDAASGKSLWKAATGTEILSVPAVSADLVIVRGSDSRIEAFEVAGGKRRWVYQRSTPALTLRSNVGVAVLPGGVAAGFPGGKLVLISLANGAQLWEAAVAMPKGATELERVTDITSSPVAGGDNICAVAYQGRVTCFSVSNGNQLWSRDISSMGGLDADDKAVYVSADQGAVLAFDISNGFNLWKQDKLANRRLSRPLIIGDAVLVADNLGIVHALNRQNGAFAARLNTEEDSPIAAEPQRMAHGIVVQTLSGAVYALSVE